MRRLLQNGLHAMPLKACTTMYLYDNLIPQIESLHNSTNLQNLYLQVIFR